MVPSAQAGAVQGASAAAECGEACPLPATTIVVATETAIPAATAAANLLDLENLDGKEMFHIP
ncbi:hypothetical protein Acsp05_16510 [Actinokineospora sp. NBRC 105648]|nr:hypothetical protein Acsp05_16510 [Actinokineospora sp. NBRC 105648]